MEEFDFSKLIWGVVIVAYFLMQWMGRKATAMSEQVAQEQGEELEPLFEQEHREVVTFKEAKQSDDRGKDSMQVERGGESESSAEKVDFDLRKAVIMSEVLNPKFKDE